MQQLGRLSRLGLLLTIVMLTQLSGSPSARAARPAIMAVLLFDYSGRDPTLLPLGEGLAQMLISDLSDATHMQIVERKKLKAVMEEAAISRSAAADPRTAARLGKLLGAGYLVLGSYFSFGDALRIDARLVEVETARIIHSVGARGTGADFWAIEQDLAEKLRSGLVKALPKRAPPRTIDAPRAAPPKATTTQVVTIGEALDECDRGRPGKALAKVKAPGFPLPPEMLKELLRPSACKSAQK